MGYWMHVFSQTSEVMEVETIREFFEDEDVTVSVYGDQTGRGLEKQITLSHRDGRPIADVHLHVGDVSADVEEAIENVLQTEPVCNAEWVAEFLRGVKTVYSFQILSGVDVNGGWEYVRDLMHKLREGFDGILHAEGEGFSNQAGYHVTWEFDDDASGVWWMALHDPKTDRWTCFQMELGNAKQCAAFRAGRVPKGVKVK